MKSRFIVIVLIFILSAVDLSAQAKTKFYPFKPYPVDHQFRLVNSKDTSRTVEFQNREELQITLYDIPGDTVLKSISQHVTGFLESGDRESLMFEVTEEIREKKYQNGGIFTVHTYFNKEWIPKDSVQRRIGINDVKEIRYSGYKRTNAHNLASVGIELSVLTTVLVAPLISINYGKGTFDSGKYFQWAGVGLIGASLSIPIAVLCRPRTYKMKPGNELPSKDMWTIQEIPGWRATWKKPGD